MNETDKQQPMLTALGEELQQVQQIARQSMAYASDLGAAIRFLEQSHECREYRQLASQLQDTLTSLGMDGIVRLLDEDHVPVVQHPAHDASHTDVLDNHDGQQRISSSGSCTLFSYPHCQILIANMPVTDEYRYGILKDTLATLANGASNRTRALLRDIRLRDRQEQLLQVLEDTAQHFNGLSETLSTQTRQTITAMVSGIRDIMAEMDIMQAQEQSIIELMQDYTEQHNRLTRENLELDQHLRAITELVTHISDMHEEPPARAESPPAASSQSGIELF